MKSKPGKISPAVRARYEKRRLQLEKTGTQDPENAMQPIEFWDKAVIGKHYRPIKTPVSIRIDNDVLARGRLSYARERYSATSNAQGKCAETLVSGSFGRTILHSVERRPARLHLRNVDLIERGFHIL
jgi:uncharacterized protein (DUF4415 family)